jgi:hypothetical protein
VPPASGRQIDVLIVRVLRSWVSGFQGSGYLSGPICTDPFVETNLSDQYNRLSGNSTGALLCEKQQTRTAAN